MTEIYGDLVWFPFLYGEKRKGKKLTPAYNKKRKVDEESQEKSSPERRVRLLSDSNESKNSRNVACVSDKERAGSLESGSGLTLSVPELDSIVTV